MTRADTAAAAGAGGYGGGCAPALPGAKNEHGQRPLQSTVRVTPGQPRHPLRRPSSDQGQDDARGPVPGGVAPVPLRT